MFGALGREKEAVDKLLMLGVSLDDLCNFGIRNNMCLFHLLENVDNAIHLIENKYLTLEQLFNIGSQRNDYISLKYILECRDCIKYLQKGHIKNLEHLLALPRKFCDDLHTLFHYYNLVEKLIKFGISFENLCKITPYSIDITNLRLFFEEKYYVKQEKWLLNNSDALRLFMRVMKARGKLKIKFLDQIFELLPQALRDFNKVNAAIAKSAELGLSFNDLYNFGFINIYALEYLLANFNFEQSKECENKNLKADKRTSDEILIAYNSVLSNLQAWIIHDEKYHRYIEVVNSQNSEKRHFCKSNILALPLTVLQHFANNDKDERILIDALNMQKVLRQVESLSLDNSAAISVD